MTSNVPRLLKPAAEASHYGHWDETLRQKWVRRPPRVAQPRWRNDDLMFPNMTSRFQLAHMLDEGLEYFVVHAQREIHW